jgi:UDP-N-acetyl-D-mannosaminuronate dehydrogenase
VRESPALDIMHLLEKRGARVTYSDPYVPSVRLDGQRWVGMVSMLRDQNKPNDLMVLWAVLICTL